MSQTGYARARAHTHTRPWKLAAVEMVLLYREVQSAGLKRRGPLSLEEARRADDRARLRRWVAMGGRCRGTGISRCTHTWRSNKRADSRRRPRCCSRRRCSCRRFSDPPPAAPGSDCLLWHPARCCDGGSWPATSKGTPAYTEPASERPRERERDEDSGRAS